MGTLYDWLSGNLSSAGRIWTALAPALFLGGYFIFGLFIYIGRSLIKGGYHDLEVESRGSTAILGMRARNYFAWVVRPVFAGLSRMKVPANAVTTLSVLLACGAGVSVAVGRFALGGWLYLFAGVCDFLDGRLARESGQAGPAGAALDSVLDRYAEGAILVGLAWYYQGTWVLLPVLLAIVGSGLVPYVRARGEGLGVDVKVGIMQRPERLVVLGLTVAFSPVLAAWLVPTDARPMHWLAVIGILILALASNVTAMQRLVHVVRKLEPKRSAPSLLSVGRGSAARNAIAAVAATAVDFAVYLSLTTFLDMVPWVAVVLACTVGGVVNFTMNRLWTFHSEGNPISEAGRYFFVSASSAMLNAGGVAILLFLPNMDDRFAWFVVRSAVFLAWNYPLHRDYVFTAVEDGPSDANVPAV